MIDGETNRPHGRCHNLTALTAARGFKDSGIRIPGPSIIYLQWLIETNLTDWGLYPVGLGAVLVGNVVIQVETKGIP